MDPFVQRLEHDYYLSETVVRDAIAHRASFNVIHLDTMYKVFALKDRPYTQAECDRVIQAPLAGDPSRSYPLSSPEDTILNKLEWYRDGGGVSDRQWTDLFNIMKVQGSALDQGYLQKWASALGLTELLGKSQREAQELGP